MRNQVEVSKKHFIAAIVVCLFVSACTNFMHIGVDRAKTIALYQYYQSLQKQIDLQQEMINLQWEEIEEIADAKATTR